MLFIYIYPACHEDSHDVDASDSVPSCCKPYSHLKSNVCMFSVQHAWINDLCMHTADMLIFIAYATPLEIFNVVFLLFNVFSCLNYVYCFELLFIVYCLFIFNIKLIVYLIYFNINIKNKIPY